MRLKTFSLGARCVRRRIVQTSALPGCSSGWGTRQPPLVSQFSLASDMEDTLDKCLDQERIPRLVRGIYRLGVSRETIVCGNQLCEDGLWRANQRRSLTTFLYGASLCFGDSFLSAGFSRRLLEESNKQSHRGHDGSFDGRGSRRIGGEQGIYVSGTKGKFTDIFKASWMAHNLVWRRHKSTYIAMAWQYQNKVLQLFELRASWLHDLQC